MYFKYNTNRTIFDNILSSIEKNIRTIKIKILNFIYHIL